MARRRSTQRDTNLVSSLFNMARSIMNISELICTGGRPPAVMLEALEQSCLDLLAFSREYRRKVSPIEIKGQRA